MQIKVTKRNLKITEAQLNTYRTNRVVHRAHVPNLRFGKLALVTDADVDG